jgi:endonuclease/exonuclease/phosphatase (EEP) superfamily protein YafD
LPVSSVTTQSIKTRASARGQQRPDRLRTALLAASLSLCLGISLCYGLRADGCAAITIFPAWVWPAPGLLLAALGWHRAGQRAATAVGLLWVLYLLVFAEEWRSLARVRPWPAAEPQAARAGGQALRVVSLNCAGGSTAAAAEVAAYRPDVVLLQESPGRRDVERLGRELFGVEAGVLAGVDASILVRGRLTPRDLPRALGSDFVQARARLTSGIEAEVISLRLTPALVRTDLWSPDCWRAQRENRQVRREQVRAIAAQIAALSPDTPLIVGGDFNAPAGDAIFRLLRPRLRDTFRQTGTGWGNTILNDIPLQRIDQIWVSDGFRAAGVVARKTRNSDHRMVIADLRWSPEMAAAPDRRPAGP